jgi:hypothetical protein
MTVAPVAADAEPATVTATAVGDRQPSPARRPVLDRVPGPAEDGGAVDLAGVVAGGLDGVRGEWGTAGGQVLLTGRRPFLEVSAQAGFGPDGALTGDVAMRAVLTAFGRPLGDATWNVTGWAPGQEIVLPGARLDGSTLRVDLRALPPGAALRGSAGLPLAAADGIATVRLPDRALRPGEPLSPRLAQAFGTLLGADLAGRVVHRDAPLGEAPAFVSERDLFFAPGRYGGDAPEALRLLDAALRASLAGVVGAVLATASGGPRAAPPAEAAAEPAVPAVVDPAAPPAISTAEPAGLATAAEPAAPESTTTEAATGETADTGPAAAAEAGATATTAGAPVTDGEGAGGGTAPVVEVLMPPAPSAPTPEMRVRGAAVTGGAAAAARAARNLPSAAADTADARASVTEPAAETAARAKEELAGALGERPAPSPEIVELVTRIRTAIETNRPQDEKQLLRTDPTVEARRAGETVSGTVQGQVDASGSAYNAMAAPPAGTPAKTGTPVPAPDPSSPGMAVAATSAAPTPLPAEKTSLGADVTATDQRIAGSGIETPVTAEIHDGPFQAARDARGGLGELAARTPAEIQAEQQAAIDTAQADMARLQLEAVGALRAARAGSVGAVGGTQTSMAAQEVHTRAGAAQQAQTIYDDAQRRVTGLLTPLSRTAMARWEAGLAQHSQAFRDALDRVQRWIDDRHSGAIGTVVAIGDYIGGLPRWVTDEYIRAERQFGNDVGQLLLDISSDVNGVIAAAQAVIQQARAGIAAVFARMEADFPGWAAQEGARFAGLLDGLAAQVTAARTSFVRDVSAAAVTAVNEAHAAVEERRRAAGGLIGQVVAAIEEFVKDPVRAIINGLLRLVHIPPDAFWALVAQIQQVAADIAADPVTFLNNLVAGVKQGFQQFFDHFGTHLLGAFWKWLFSGLKTPIPMPTAFDAPSLFTFALQLMGITWPRVREILVRHLGPTAVTVLETAWRLITLLVERGPGGLVDLIKEQLTPENIVGMILDAAIDYLAETLVVQAAVYLFSLLNPAGAVAQAIRLIYKVCAWIFRNAARIFAFVQAVVGGIADVVAGNIGGLATAVERGLASMMVVALDFLAGLAGLDGLPGKVADVIGRLQAYVLSIVERVVVFLVTRARVLLARLGIGGKKKDPAHGHADDELGTTVRFTAGRELHRTWITRQGGDATLMVGSTPVAIRDKITEWRGRVPSLKDPDDRATADAKLGELAAMLDALDAEADTLAQAFESAARDPRDDEEPPSDDSLEGRQRGLADLLREVFVLFEGIDPQKYLNEMPAPLRAFGAEYTETVRGQWEKAITAPKLAPDGTTALWDVSVVSEVGALVYVTRGSTRQQLLPYFLVGSQREGNQRRADTGAFKNYVYETDSPDPAHVVRTEFLRVLGTDTVTRMKRAALRTVSSQDNATLARRIQEMSFTSAGGRWGAFVGIPGDSVNPLLRTAIERAGGIVAFLTRMVAPGSSDGVGFAQFCSVWQTSPETKNYVKGLFRQVDAGAHEWIPTGYVVRVLQTAVDAANAGDVRTGFRWVEAQNALRSPTRYVLHRPLVLTRRIARGERSDLGPAVDVALSGHVGAFREERDGALVSTGTMGTEVFHDWLRAEFDQQNALGPVAYIAHLQDQLPSRVWDGSTGMFPDYVMSQPVGMFYRCEDGVDRALTVGQLALRQRLNWQRIQEQFAAARARTEAAPATAGG